MFSVIMLKKSLGALQWVALVFLLSGVGLVQVAQSGATAGRTGGHDQNKLLGFVAVIVSCCMSGFAGVYFEKILKGSDVSVWMRNIQLSFLSIPFSLITTFVNDGHQVREEGFFVSYNGVVWFVVFMYALGGLVVAAVVKYADNILKGFATSLAIVIACVASIYMFDFNVTYLFVLGTSLVIVSIFMYGHPSAAAVQAGVRSPGKGILMKV